MSHEFNITWIIKRYHEPLSDFYVFLLFFIPVDGSGEYLAAAPVREQKERLLNVNVRPRPEVTVVATIDFNDLKT